MKWSWRLGQVSGIGIYVHWTFLILIGWIVLVYVRQGADAGAVVRGIVFVLAVFACIVLHELGHALTAKRFGIGTRDITLLPIGGVARLERMPENPTHELLVAAAGPAVNVVIAFVLFALIAVTSGLPSPGVIGALDGDGFARLAWVNLFLVGFNLLPAFPMDGGRVLRALLAHRLEYVRATQIAANVGQLMAIVFGFIGLLFNPFLLFIALFVYLGAQEEAHAVQMRSVFRNLPVKEAMVTRFQTLLETDTLGRARDELLAGSQQDFPVVRDGRVVGLLARKALIKALSDVGTTASVGDVMQENCPAVRDTAMLDEAFQRMRGGGCSTIAVVRGGRLIGVLTLENVGEFMMVQTALQGAGR